MIWIRREHSFALNAEKKPFIRLEERKKEYKYAQTRRALMT